MGPQWLGFPNQSNYRLSGTLRIMRCVILPANRLISAGLAAFLFPVYQAFQAVRFIGLRAGVNAIASMAMGDDLSAQRITSISRRPVDLVTEDLVIPDAIDNEMMEIASRGSLDVIHGVYGLHSASAALNVGEFVRKSLSDPYIIHSQYCRHDRLIEQVAAAVASHQNGTVQRCAELVDSPGPN
jgi:hypothetical protein